MNGAFLGLSPGGKVRLALLATLAALVLAPAGASAASIVYIQNGNVYLAAPDGSNQRQVTTGGNWSSPSQADDGTILAEEGTQLFRLDRQGHVLATINTIFTDPAGPGWTGPVSATISPDGVNQAYSGDVVGGSYYDPGCGCYDENDHFSTWWGSATQYSQPNQGIGQDGYVSPAWIDNSHLLLSEATIGADQVATYTLGGGDNSEVGWFSEGDPVGSLNYGTITRQGDKLAFIASLNGGESYQLRLFQTNGPPPEAAGDPSDLPTDECDLGLNNWEPRRLSFSPDGGSLAFGGPQGIVIVTLTGWPTCADFTSSTIIPGGTQPYFGPADVGANDGCGACTGGGSGGGGGGNGGGSTGGGSTTFQGFTVTHWSVRHGVITLSVSGKSAGRFAARATFGKTRRYGSASARLRHAGVVKLTIKPASKSARALARAKRKTVTVTITFTPAGGSAHVGHVKITV